MWEEDDVLSLGFQQQSGMFDGDATASTTATMPTLRLSDDSHHTINGDVH